MPENLLTKEQVSRIYKYLYIMLSAAPWVSADVVEDLSGVLLEMDRWLWDGNNIYQLCGRAEFYEETFLKFKKVWDGNRDVFINEYRKALLRGERDFVLFEDEELDGLFSERI